jgi:quinate dehydrogenase (quinone)
MGSSSVDICGAAAHRKLDHRYATSILALDASTGKQKWVYQTVHNDLWDFDLPMQPSLIDFPTRTAPPPRPRVRLEVRPDLRPRPHDGQAADAVEEAR